MPLLVSQCRFLFNEICTAVDYLHCNYIVHRDLKLENIFIGKEKNYVQIKLGDFGYSSIISNNQKKFNEMKGTKKGYMAP
jgi:serine/threonine protein kinase